VGLPRPALQEAPLAAELLAIPPQTSRLRQRVGALRDSHAALWAATAPELPPLEGTDYRSRSSAARATARLVDALAGEIRSVPDGMEARARWRDSIRERLQELGRAHLRWPDGYRRLLFGDAYFESSRAFAREARRFDPALPLEDLWQALRNVWIGNSLQMLLDLPVRLRPGLFAYSMLYPVTDNLLDEPTRAAEAKRAFNARFGRRLAGSPVSPAGARDSAAFRLVEMIEAEFPRRSFPDVFESLLAIHAGQVRSLDQQGQRILTGAELLATSCEKGGTSVLADLYLVAGEASPAQERFAFGYGVLLQLLDDLQDVERDLAAGHQTLFTQAARSGPLDAITARLSRFADGVLEAGPAFAGPAFAERRDLIRRNCLTLLVGAVAEQPGRFTWRFRRRLERRWPLSLGALRRLRRRTQRRFGRAAEHLRRRTGAASLLDWALAQPL
jgi:hypothetical protein